MRVLVRVVGVVATAGVLAGLFVAGHDGATVAGVEALFRAQQRVDPTVRMPLVVAQPAA